MTRKVLICTVLAIGLSLVIQNTAPLFRANAEFNRVVDFAAFYTASVGLQDPATLYDYDRQKKIQSQFMRVDLAPAEERLFIYPPFFAPLTYPLRFLSFDRAYVALLLVNLALLTVTVYLFAPSRWLYLLAFGLAPIYTALMQGQTTFLILLLLCLYVRDFGKPRSGVWAALCLFKPHIALLPLVLLLWQRHTRAVLYAAVTGLALGLISLALVGIDGLMAWALLVQRIAADQPAQKMMNLASLGWVWVAPLFLVPLFALRKTDALFWTLVVLAILLVSPHTYYADLTLLLLPAVFIFSDYGEKALPWLYASALSIFVAPQFELTAHVLVALFMLTSTVLVLPHRRAWVSVLSRSGGEGRDCFHRPPA